ncbi:InlB B-repeat-containing protein [Bifidobacterium simiarum]|nr:InlB B-repeat-containing protein [Bifidobacterium simiarum]
MRTGRPAYLSRLWKIGIGAVASVAMLLPMGAVANAAEEGVKGSAAASASSAAGGASAAAGDIPITAKYFPDAAFREDIGDSDYDKNMDGLLDPAERNDVTEIELGGDVKSAKGIELFPNLSAVSLNALGGGALTSLDVSHNAQLTELHLTGAQLSSLDVSHNPKLQTLSVTGKTAYTNGKPLSSLDVSRNPELQELEFEGNHLSSLDVSHNPKLQTLTVDSNRLTSLDVSHNPKLSRLTVGNNRLSSLDVSHNPEIDFLLAEDNQLSSLNVTRNPQLATLDVENNRLSIVDVSHNPKLSDFRIDNNPLLRLDVSRNPELSYLTMSNTRVSSVDLSHNALLETLDARGSQLYAVDASRTSLKAFDGWHGNQGLINNRLLAYRESPKREQLSLTGQRAFPVDGYSLNLRQLIPWFDLSKVSNVRGGTISRTGVIAPVAGAKAGAVVSYDYAAGASGTLHASVSFTMKGAPAQVVYRTVAFNSNGGSKVASQKVANGAKVAQPKNPTRAGYAFAGWYYGNAKWDFNRGVTANITLTAKWTKNTTPSKPTVKQVPVYRVYNRRSGLHHYTTNKAEKDMLVRLGWRDESRKAASFITVSKGTPGARPVYREYNRRTGNHNWTLNKAEHDMLVRLGWRNEGVAWYAPSSGKNVYRLYNRNSGEHVYTMSYGEYVAVQRAGWRGEGIAWKSL